MNDIHWAKRLAIAIPGKAKALGRARACIRAGRIAHYTPAASREWERVVEVYARQYFTGPAILRPVRLDLAFYLPMPATKAARKAMLARHGFEDELREFPLIDKPDLDNLVKGVMDGLTKADVWRDDCQIADLRASKWAVSVAGDARAEVTIWEMAQ